MRKFKTVLTFLLPCLVPGLAGAQPNFDNTEFRSVPVSEGVLMLKGAGGNIGVLQDPRGPLIIDDDYQQLSEKLIKTLEEVAPGGTRLLLNTHWHGDHTGGNLALGLSGAVIIAHENVRLRLESGGEIAAFGLNIPPAQKEALPIVTYDSEISIHWGGKRLSVAHSPSAHTDGDSVIYIYDGDELVAVHTGDLFFNGFYPFVDSDSGGSAQGMVKGVAEILQRVSDDTPIIPGHGPLATKADLQAFHDFMAVAVSRIEQLKKKGMSRQAVIDSRPIREFEAEWGDGFLTTDNWIGIVYDALSP